MGRVKGPRGEFHDRVAHRNEDRSGSRCGVPPDQLAPWPTRSHALRFRGANEATDFIMNIRGRPAHKIVSHIEDVVAITRRRWWR